MKRSLLLLALAVFGLGSVLAQEMLHVHTHNLNAHWDFPLFADSLAYADVSDDQDDLRLHVKGDAVVPFDLSVVDSLVVSDESFVETKDKYKVFQLYITTNDGRSVTSKEEYKPCQIMLNARGSFSNYSASAGIRGRGNSSWLWYDKKPYRIKLDQKHKLLGLAKAKSWVLLANYRDVTDLMNTFVFQMGEWMGLPFTNHTRYVELFLNGDYKGIYQLTEQVQQGSNRVNISDDGGILLSLDVDDGPGEDPYAEDNFYSQVYRMPAAVKYPDDEYFTDNTVDSVKAEFAILEQAIKDKDYERVKTLLDIPSFIKYLQIQEFIYNVELSAPRSIYLHKDGDGKWFMGPLWDFDAGYDFEWSNMMTGHTFFSNYKETVMGSNPYKRNGNYNYVPQFFTDLFGCSEFVQAYKDQWAAVKDSIVERNWKEMENYIVNLRRACMPRESNRWPISGKTFNTEVEKMHEWLENRCAFLTNLIENIPMPDDTPIHDEQVCGTITTDVTMNWYDGYQQSNKVRVSKSDVLELMGVSESEFNEGNVTIVPLMNDGSEGSNGTNGVFGGWFDENGEPGAYAQGHVYIEVFNDLWNWDCGLYQNNCYDEEHTVTMQYQYPYDGVLKKVNVDVHFTIEWNGGGWWW
ncbi:MAG: CotH kinase family protein [Prevotella sp.]|nr:CotH kinase family protein [Prevotella sp.]